MAIAPTALSLKAFLTLPEEEPAFEFAEGVVTQKVSPKGRHSLLQGELIKRFDQAGQRTRTARAFPELRVTFGGSSFVPDVAMYRWQRIPVDSEGLVSDIFQIPPDIAMEIVSPEQSVNALVRRCLWYVAHGVELALLVDLHDESVLSFRAGEPSLPWHGADLIDVGDIVPELGLTVTELFSSLRHQ